jgi:hypothetical protein
MVIKVQKSLLSFSLETSMHLVEKAQSDVLSLPQNQDSSPGPHPASFSMCQTIRAPIYLQPDHPSTTSR